MSDLRLKCTKFDFGWGSAPHPAGGDHGAPPDRVDGFKGPTSKGRGGQGREEQGRGRGSGGRRKWEEGGGKGGEEREREGDYCLGRLSA